MDAGQFDTAGPGGKTRHAEHAEPGRERRHRGFHPLGALPCREAVFLPAAKVADVLTFCVSRVSGPKHLSQRLGGGHCTRAQGLARRHVAPGHRGALVGVKGQVDMPDHEFALGWLRQGLVHDLEVTRLGDTSQ